MPGHEPGKVFFGQASVPRSPCLLRTGETHSFRSVPFAFLEPNRMVSSRSSSGFSRSRASTSGWVSAVG
ncbi:MAG: CRISPR-associated DxTHG motif protein [Chloroflexi bacterium]|nr:CRISPR-associated DxTHG motif protein [Chloroflexota bacterium]